MTFKRKSVTFHEKVSTIYPRSFDGSSSPAAITNVPATPQPPPNLDPMYLTWLRTATKAQYPFILNRTFAKYIYLQNFDNHQNLRQYHNRLTAEFREAAVLPLAEKYGSLGWGNLYEHVDEGAWLKNYREIYHFDGSDEQLLEKIAEAYAQIKTIIAEEEKMNEHLTADASIHISLSNRQWVTFTQGVGALTNLDFEPICLKEGFDVITDEGSDGEEGGRVDGGEQGAGNGGFEDGVSAGAEGWMFGAGDGESWAMQ